MLAELHVELVRHRLQHTLEQADTANFEVELDVRDEAIEVVVSGFSDSLPALVRTIMQEVLRPMKASEVASELGFARIELEREYRNATQSPRAKAYELRLQMLEIRAVTTDDKLEALQSKEGREKELAADISHFSAVLVSGPAIRSLVTGNISQEAAIAIVLDVVNAEAVTAGDMANFEPESELEPEPPLLAPRCHTIAIPPTTNGLLVRRESERIGERNSIVEVYFQIGKVGPEDRAYAVLLRALLAQPLFNELRTRQQLGYTVTCSIRDTHGVLGLSVSVQSASHAAGAVAKKLDVFLHEDFLHEYLLSEKRLPPKHFTSHVQTLQRVYARPDLTLTEQSERYWEEIVSGRLEFDLDINVANALESCTREGLIARYRCWLQGSTSCCNTCTDNYEERKSVHRANKNNGPRKLRVHVVGKCSPLKPLEQLVPSGYKVVQAAAIHAQTTMKNANLCIERIKTTDHENYEFTCPLKPLEQLVPPEKAPVIITGDLDDFKRGLQCHCQVDACR
ncbi:Nardilysin [Phytophthora megakarya]|uniref:Nardilysin n=1 Tax=Phytophthora megakarya TaxID=4795 RepID=A0A225UUZ3_9STRA|nr:Nardilysin [Phytophthora megakarya]